MNQSNQLLPNLAAIWLETLGWQPDENQQQQLQKLYDEIILGNRQLNLTRITEPHDFWEKHLWDSLAPIGENKTIDTEAKLKVIDVGTGAGFPGIPVAITYPNWSVTLLDSTRKKIHFLSHLLAVLNLKNSQPIIGRAEEIGQNKTYRETYDLACVRAIGNASVCAEYALPLLKIGGTAILYRGNWQATEELSLRSALKQLGGEISQIYPFKTPLTQSIRHSIYLQKITKTPAQFPRLAGVPTQKPL